MHHGKIGPAKDPLCGASADDATTGDAQRNVHSISGSTDRFSYYLERQDDAADRRARASWTLSVRSPERIVDRNRPGVIPTCRTNCRVK